jgi:acetyl esterase/lipase
MVSIRGKLLNWYFTRIGFKTGMAKDIARGNRRAAEPTAKVLGRNSVEVREFEGRKLWYIYPKSWAVSGKTRHPKTALLFFHGGAYFYDVMDLHFATWAKIADLSDALIILPSYPLAPEVTPSEIGVYAQGVQYEVKVTLPAGTKLIAGGDSAGAGLALQMCQRLSDAGEALPEHLILWSPWTDVSDDSPELKAQDKRSTVLGLEGLKTAAKLYRGDVDPKDPIVSPIYGDLSDLPPMTIVTGSRDLLHSDILRFAKTAKTAGAQVDLQIWPEQNHYFMYLPQPEAKKIAQQTAALIRSF